MSGALNSHVGGTRWRKRHLWLRNQRTTSGGEPWGAYRTRDYVACFNRLDSTQDHVSSCQDRCHDVITLIDSRSTHNFINERVANLLRLPVIPTETFTVRVANGENLRCHGRFDEVPVNLQGINFSLTLYSLPLTELNIVLGIHWLGLLGFVVCNWKRLTMEFS